MSPHEPYDEATIVSLWTEIFQTQLALDYYPSPDSIVYAPVEGHAINEEICKKLKLSSAVVSLMKHLPYPRDFDIAHDFPIFEGSVAIPYTQEDQILFARDPDNDFAVNDEEEIRRDFLLPSEIALVVSIGEGLHLILDTAASIWLRHPNYE